MKCQSPNHRCFFLVGFLGIPDMNLKIGKQKKMLIFLPRKAIAVLGTYS